MVTTMDDFSNWFIPLIILGSWCLFEGGHILQCSNVSNHLKSTTFILDGMMAMQMIFSHFSSSEIVILCKRCKGWPLPYRLTGVTLFPDDAVPRT